VGTAAPERKQAAPTAAARTQEGECWTIALETPSPLPYQLGFMVGLAEEVSPSTYQAINLTTPLSYGGVVCVREALPWGPAADGEEGCRSANEVVHKSYLVEREVEGAGVGIDRDWYAWPTGDGEYIYQVLEEDVADSATLHVPHLVGEVDCLVEDRLRWKE
jgi:hypothetical protein